MESPKQESNTPKLIGVEEHWCPRELFEEEGTPGHESIAGTRSILAPEQYDMAVQSISDIGARRIALMDRLGLSAQVLSLSGAIMEQLDGQDAVRFSRLSNDILAEGIAASKGRLYGFAAIPTSAPEEAAREIERCSRLQGFAGVVVNGHVGGHYLDEARFEPVLDAAERSGMPIYLHPAMPPRRVVETCYSVASEYGSRVLATGGWGWHIDTGTHVLRLIASGAFDRHPRLQVIVGHLGEGLPFFMQRLENAIDPALERPYASYLRSNVAYTISGFHDPDLLEYTIKKVGHDRIMFSTDYPFNQPSREIEAFANAPLNAYEREAIAHENAERLLRL